MTAETCGCGKGDAVVPCPADDSCAYWCETCKRPVPQKRCPYCGLKSQKRKPVG